MTVQIVNIHIPYVFKRYVTHYNIYRDLHEVDLLGLEIRNIDKELAENTRHIIFRNKEICYVKPTYSDHKVDLLILGSFGIFKELAKDIVAVGNEDLGYKINRVLANSSQNFSFSINNKIKNQNALVMGIVNVTPDSFSDGGKFLSTNKAIEHGIGLLEDGADILDIGGESTKPGSEAVSKDEELKRVITVIEGIIKHKKDAVISIDTTKSIVAEESIKRGAAIINDISAGTIDANIFDIAVKYSTPIILMHMKGIPKNMQDNPYYEDAVREIYDYLHERILLAEKKGIQNIIIDPGIGFGKRVSDNYEILERLSEFKGLGKHILIGLSRKSFVGKSLGLNIDQREEATLAAETLAIKNGANIIRTHKVYNTKQASLICNYFENPQLINND